MEISDNNVQYLYISQDNTNLHRDAMKEIKREKEKRSVLDRGKFFSLISVLKKKKKKIHNSPRL